MSFRMNKGLFITFEGVDGSGKTTQLNLLKNYLEEKGFDCEATQEPGALSFGKKIRDIILNSEENISDNAELFLFLADRAQHADNFIRPNLNRGKAVLCDRYVDSTLAYQGYGRNRNIELLRRLNDMAVSGIMPDLTLLYDVSEENAIKRLNRQKDRMELSGAEFYRKVKNGYLMLQKEEPQRIKIINANNPIDIVYNNTKELADELILRKSGG